MKRFLMLLGGVLLVAASCNKMEEKEVSPVLPEEPVVADEPLYTIYAGFEGSEDTRSRFEIGQEVTKVLWTRGDSFRMYGRSASGGSSRVFTTQDDGVSGAAFTGNALDNYSDYYSVYPAAKVRSGNASGTFVPIVPVYPNQVAVAGGVAEGVNIAVAYSKTWNEDLTFKNVLSYVRFKVTGDAVAGLASVTLEASVDIAGDLSLEWTDGEPSVSFKYNWTIVDAERSSSITLSGPFEEGKDYLIALPPVTLNGFDLVFRDASGKQITKHTRKTLAMKRAEIYNFGTIDLGDEYSVPVGEDIIKYMTQTKGDNPVDICVISEGFQLSELELYRNLARSGIDFLFNTEPYKTYKDYFNVYILSVPSRESGASITDGSGTIVTDRDTYFKAKWGADSYQDMSANSSKVFNFVKERCPEIVSGDLTIQDVPILMIINDPRYGGICHSVSDGRGYGMVPYTLNDQGQPKSMMWGLPSPVPNGNNGPSDGAHARTQADLDEVGGYSRGDWRNTLVHEFGGHCFGRLKDEYWGTSYYPTPVAVDTHDWDVPMGLNITHLRDNPTWKTYLLDHRDELVARDERYARIGVYQGAGGEIYNKWRSEMISCMIDNRCYFSTWQRILIVKRILEKAGEVTSWSDFPWNSFYDNDVTLDPVRDLDESALPGFDWEHAELMPPLAPPVLIVAED
jgi:hypothetical protein